MIPCKCGHVISTVIGPCPDGYRLASESKMESLRGNDLSGDDVVSEIFLRTAYVYKCPKCERLLVSWDRKNKYRYYRPDP